jgi:hypothetical protein
MKEKPISIYFCCLSCNCPFEATISIANVLHQQIILGHFNFISTSLALEVKRTYFETPLQIAFATHKLAPSPRFLKTTITNQW